MARTARETRTRRTNRVRRKASPRPRPKPKPVPARNSAVDAAAVWDAAAALRGVAVRTPLLYVEALGAHLKLENLQPMGAFKIRGAYNAIRKLPEAARRHGVITYSSGNHGQAVA